MALPATPLCWLELNDIVGTDAPDSSGNGNNGTLVNLTDADMVTVGDYTGLHRTGAGEKVTLPAFGLDDEDQTFLFRFRCSGSTGTYAVSSRNAADGGLSCLMNNGANNAQSMIDSSGNITRTFASMNDGNWHEIAFSYDKAPTRTINYYYDRALNINYNPAVGTWNEAGVITQLFERVGGTIGGTATMSRFMLFDSLLTLEEINQAFDHVPSTGGEADTGVVGDVTGQVTGYVSGQVAT